MSRNVLDFHKCTKCDSWHYDDEKCTVYGEKSDGTCEHLNELVRVTRSMWTYKCRLCGALHEVPQYAETIEGL